MFIIPSHTALVDIKKEVADSRIRLGAQNMHWEDTGAYTGEISPKMLNEIGLDLIELGHSNEDNILMKMMLILTKSIGCAEIWNEAFSLHWRKHRSKKNEISVRYLRLNLRYA
ncbi:triose-phosphate isomerase [Bacillus sp. N9]